AGRPVWITAICCLLSTGANAQWRDHEIRQLNGQGQPLRFPARAQALGEKWGRSVQMPYLIYMPEKDELLLLFLSERPTRALLSRSRDRGATWTEPVYMHVDSSGKPDTPGATSLTYLGVGKAMLVVAEGQTDWNWVSDDFGHSWQRVPRPQASPGKPFLVWDPLYVDKGTKPGEVRRLAETGYVSIGKWEEGGYSQGVIRFSTDAGRTWGPTTMVPQWRDRNEIVMTRAKNGDLVAACRSDSPPRFRRLVYDNYSGLGISVSKDDGRTWSEMNVLFDWGRHHPSMVVLPDGDIVMTYVVRRGYPNTPGGFAQMGIEAVVSHDNGQSWDLDHRYLLVTWPSLVKGPDGAYIAQSQSTSSVLLPDGSIVTSYGGAQRAVRTVPGASDPRDLGFVHWRVEKASLNADRTISRAPFDSDLRNRLDLNRLNGVHRGSGPGTGRRNIAIKEEGVRVTSTASDQAPAHLLHDDYVDNLVTLRTIPAWVELQWKKRRRIGEVRIHPGAPAIAKQPTTECVPLDYRLQYKKGREWIDLAPPVTNAKRYRDFDPKQRHPLTLDKEFEYVHTFPPTWVNAVRIYITRSSDEGKRFGPAGAPPIPEAARETVLREVEVFESSLQHSGIRQHFRPVVHTGR
ncbi:MAG: sialidase family protein, partial [Bryobacteraceae bacterium]